MLTEAQTEYKGHCVSLIYIYIYITRTTFQKQINISRTKMFMPVTSEHGNVIRAQLQAMFLLETLYL
jgi:hypothetical protein